VIEILSSNGDVYCGGSDIDKIVSNWIIKEFNNENPGFDIATDTMAISRIKEAAEKAKVELSNVTMTDINLPYITAIDNFPKHFVKTLSRAKFESLIEDEITKVIDKGREAVRKSGLKYSDLDGILLVGGTTRIPYVQERLTKEFGVPLIKNINPDEAVSLGAAIQGGVLTGEVNDIVLLDVTPLNLGIDTMGGVMNVLVEANTNIPTSKSNTFTTAVDNQPGVDIVVLQGNRPMSADNKVIGKFTLEGIAPAPRGVPKIEVTFNIDVNGIVTVKAVDKATNKEQQITISNNGGISNEDIERMKAEAEQYKEEDKKKAEEANIINGADHSIFSVEANLNREEFKDDITDEEREKMKPLIEAAKEALNERDIEKIKTTTKALNDGWTPIITRLYQPPKDSIDPSQFSEDAKNPFAAN
jgi:molecular chaperone DnaK